MAAGLRPDPVPWFVKTERFLRPYAEMRPHLQAHRLWVEALRTQGVPISSGYLVDGEGQPGGGGLLLVQCAGYAEAAALVAHDPMLLSGQVDWLLQEWRPAVGDLGVAALSPPENQRE
jgi:hypothetical protein